MKEFEQLSKRQKTILRFMEQYIDDHGFPPTIREIGVAADINSTSVVNYNLNKLVDAGYLERSDRVSRGMRLVRDLPGSKPKIVELAQANMAIPMMGQIVAGEPMPIYEGGESDEVIEVTPAMLGHSDTRNVFALRVQGDSMIDAMIADGDIVLLRRTETANNGDMVAVWLEERGETTLKHFYREGDRIRLQPANPYLDPIYVSADGCQVQGRVISVIRQVR